MLIIIEKIIKIKIGKYSIKFSLKTIPNLIYNIEYIHKNSVIKIFMNLVVSIIKYGYNLTDFLSKI